jgi:hypothetical protein
MANAPHIPNETETRAHFVIPAKAGIHNLQTFGVCCIGDAHALGSEYMDSRLRGNDGVN